MLKKFLASSLIAVFGVFVISSGADGGVKFSINSHMDQAFKLIEKMKLDVSEMSMSLTPADFNYLVPFGMRLLCGSGSMTVKGLRRIHQDDIYMEAMSKNESILSVKFTADEIDFKYDICWMTVLPIPLPIWLSGKMFRSTFYVKFNISYEPKCSVDVIIADMVSYEKMSLNLFKWLPGGLGDAVTEVITRNTQRYILNVVAASIETTLKGLTSVYDACMIFPSMGVMKMLPATDDGGDEDTDEDSNSKFMSCITGRFRNVFNAIASKLCSQNSSVDGSHSKLASNKKTRKNKMKHAKNEEDVNPVGGETIGIKGGEDAIHKSSVIVDIEENEEINFENIKRAQIEDTFQSPASKNPSDGKEQRLNLKDESGTSSDESDSGVESTTEVNGQPMPTGPRVEDEHGENTARKNGDTTISLQENARSKVREDL